VAVLAGLLGLVFAGPIFWLVGEWRDNPYYEHGPLVPLVSVLLVTLALKRLPLSIAMGLPGWKGGGACLGLGLLAGGLGLRVLAAAAGSELLGAVALVVVLLGLAGWWLGAAGLTSLAFPIGYLLLAVPLPFMDDLGFYFQRLSTAATATLVHLVGVPATYQGAEVSLPGSSFIVGVACSGLYSTVTLTALGALLPRVLDLRSWLTRMLLVSAIVPVALASNVFRLGSLLGIAYWQDADTAMRYYHDLGDVVFWLLALGVLMLIGRGLAWPQSRRAS